MIEECIEEPEEPKTKGEFDPLTPACFEDFDHFVSTLGEYNNRNLRFSECNRYLKLKQTDYYSDAEVIQYFKQVFSKYF